MKRSNILTTGQVAKICCVAPRTVSKWFDSGRLKGYRIPGSQDRRITRAELRKFMVEYKFPTESLDLLEFHILLINFEQDTFAALSNELTATGGFIVENIISSHDFTIGVRVGQFHPNCVVVDLDKTDWTAERTWKFFQNQLASESHRMVLIGAGTDLAPDEHFYESFKKPFDHALLAEVLQRLPERFATFS